MSTAELPRTMTNGWEEVVDATAAELAATTQGARLVELGPVRLDGARCGAFTTAVIVDTGSLRLGDRLITGLFLAEAADSRATFNVIEAPTWTGNRLEVEVDLDASQRAVHFRAEGTSSLRLFASTSDSFVVRSLHARLADVADPGPAGTLASAVRHSTTPSSDFGVMLGAAERRAEMLAALVQQLAGAARRVLVVGTDNAALDRLALACHARLGRPGPGRVLRMGVASTPEVGRERSLTALGASAALVPAIVQRLGELDQRRRALAPGATPEPPAVPAPGAVAQAPGAGSAPTPLSLEEARATLARADRALAEAETASQLAADAHGRARRRARELERARARHQRVD
ncbi:MAG: hypothetical protein GEV08_17265, partial [Acidimicrobiia bacterium]|nr:hypothetical protein [Acidimicrobiia bacterium]